MIEQPHITLVPLAMVTVTEEGIYAPSRLQQPRPVSYSEFLDRFADHPKVISVSFAPDGKSDPQQLTAYGFGMDCWYLAEVAQ